MSDLKPWQHRYLNAFVVYFVIGPAMGVAWNSIWYLLSEVIIYPEDKEISVWISFGVGYTASLLASYFQDAIYDLATGHGFVCFIIVSRLYSYAMFFVSGNSWRAIWEGLDYYTGINEKNALMSSLASYAALLILRSSRQVVFAPCVLSMDFPLGDYFKADSYFGVKKRSGWTRVGDTLFSVCFVGTLGFTVWRGFWQYLDFIIYPQDPSASGIASLVIAYGIMIGGTVVEPLTVSLNQKLYSRHFLLGLLHEDIVIFLYIIACINFWRGYGILYALYVPGGDIRFWLGHYVCCVILFFSMAFNSVIARGVALEGDAMDGQGVVAGIEYLDNFTQLWRSRPDGVKRGMCGNVFTMCFQAWRQDKAHKEKGELAGVVTAPMTSKPPEGTPDNSTGLDDVSLVLNRNGSKGFSENGRCHDNEKA